MGKKTNAVTVLLDDRDMHDLEHAADEQDRTPADMLRHLFRAFMRQNIEAKLRDRQQEDGAPAASNCHPSSVSFLRRTEPVKFADPWRDTEQQG